jgi:hypothetical protein
MSASVEIVVVNMDDEGGPQPTPTAMRDVELRGMEAFHLPGTPAAVLVDPSRAIASAPATGIGPIEALLRVATLRAPVAT